MSKEALKQIEIAEKALAEAKKALGAKGAVAAEEPEQEAEGRILYWGDDEEPTDLDAMDMKALKQFAKDAEIDITGLKKADEIRDVIYAAYQPDEDAEDDGDGEGDDDGEEISTIITIDDEEVDLADMDLKGLKAFAKENEITLSMKDKDGIIAEILEAFNAEAEDADGEGDEDGEGEAPTEEDLEAMTDDELKELCGELEIEAVTKTKKIAGKTKKVFDREGTIAAILELYNGEEEQDLATQYGLTDMDVSELGDILTRYGLSPRGKKEALIDRILENIENGTIELEDEEEGN